jgi:hypothetical protein
VLHIDILPLNIFTVSGKNMLVLVKLLTGYGMLTTWKLSATSVTIVVCREMCSADRRFDKY